MPSNIRRPTRAILAGILPNLYSVVGVGFLVILVIVSFLAIFEIPGRIPERDALGGRVRMDIRPVIAFPANLASLRLQVVIVALSIIISLFCLG